MKAGERKQNLLVTCKISKSAIVKFNPVQVSAIMKGEKRKQILSAPLDLT